MYLPPHFEPASPAELQRILVAHPLGALVRASTDPLSGGLDADHLPFEWDPSAGPLGSLLAHVARANPLWQTCPTGTEVLVIFRGAEGYVSPSWYPSKQETHRQVPTWNYEVVHAHGRLVVRDDERFVRGLLARLTRHHEAAEPQPWKMGDAPPDYLNDMLRQVVGIEVEINRLTGKAKLSQNKAVTDRHNAADTLAARGQHELAQAMRRSA